MSAKRSARTKTRTQATLITTSVPPAEFPVSAWLRKHSLSMFFVLVAIGSLRIISTYSVLSHTFDEPAHIACGMEWLAQGTWQYEAEHPPLARVAAALGPYLASGRPHTLPTMAQLGLANLGVKKMWDSGLAILYQDGQYDRRLALARLGILPFFWIASLVVYLWVRKYVDELAAVLAVFFFTFLPPILAHAGLATTDMALTAFAGATFLAALTWLANPSWLGSVLLGTTTALAILSKFSSLLFIPMALIAALIWYFAADRPGLWTALRNIRKYLLPLFLAVLTSLLIIWAGYRFSFGPVPSLASIQLPAPELFTGIQEVREHNRNGAQSYLLGEHSQTGWWYFYLVVLAVKTPIPLLILMLSGIVLVIHKKDLGSSYRGAALALAFSLGILLFAMTGHINLGVRHILPVYIGFSIVAAVGAARLLALSQAKKWAGWLLFGLMIWMAGSSLAIHPDYLSYFNVLAGEEPANVLSDSDLDWGQDLKRLARRLKEVGAPSVAFISFAPADLAAMGFPPFQPTSPVNPLEGWNAVSLSVLKNRRMGLDNMRPDIVPWPERTQPGERIGKGIWLWYFPPSNAPPRSN